MFNYLLENPITIATFLSAFAALSSVVATWQGPRAAARIAEKMRKNTERENERRRMKLQVFATLMQERATISSVQSVQMLNSIDFVFYDAAKVREAWADLYSIFSTSSAPHIQLREDKLRILLKAMGEDIGLSDNLKVDDIARIYYPNALAQQEELDSLQRQQALRRMRSQPMSAQSTQLTKIEEQMLAKFPPQP